MIQVGKLYWRFESDFHELPPDERLVILRQCMDFCWERVSELVNEVTGNERPESKYASEPAANKPQASTVQECGNCVYDKADVNEPPCNTCIPVRYSNWVSADS